MLALRRKLWKFSMNLGMELTFSSKWLVFVIKSHMVGCDIGRSEESAIG